MHQEKFILKDNDQAAALFGLQDNNLKFLEENLKAQIVSRGEEIIISGTEEDVKIAKKLIENLIELIDAGKVINVSDINYILATLTEEPEQKITAYLSEILQTTWRGKQIRPKTLGQYKYIKAIKDKDVIFGIGPAGTGKTYLAVVMAIRALRNKEVQKIILTRPAVEAGEKLGFLPGDLQDKVDPYLRPLYDGLYDLLGFELAQKYVEKGIIEIAPLAYMRGRTLDDSFIILDEAQNTTSEQMKMFLTRIGFGSKAVITGDITQVDLPKNTQSGLVLVQDILQGIPEISFQYLTRSDVVRHPVVGKIIAAYEKYQEVEERR
ncbi:MAG: PhoH family protein [Clostridia bacterium]|nr:PhoH family protein [Clostridia bacterium]